MLQAFLILAAEAAEEKHASTVPFIVIGLILAGWAVVLSGVGLRSASFPGGDRGARGVMALSTILVLATMAVTVVAG
jgi:hypothetical protein